MSYIRFKKYGDDFLQQKINESTSICEVLRKLNLKDYGSNHVDLTKYIQEAKLDDSTLVGRSINKYNSTGIPKKVLSLFLAQNTKIDSCKLKKRLLKEGVKKWKCEKCGNIVS